MIMCHNRIIVLFYPLCSMSIGHQKSKMWKMLWLPMKQPKCSYFLAYWLRVLKWFDDFMNEFLALPNWALMTKTFFFILPVWSSSFWGPPIGKKNEWFLKWNCCHVFFWFIFWQIQKENNFFQGSEFIKPTKVWENLSGTVTQI